MKTLPALMSAIAVLLLASCTSPIVKRIERNPELYNALSTEHKALVQRGAIQEGMTKPAVFLAWGRPDRAAQGSDRGRKYERWSYAGYDPTYTMGLGYGPASFAYGRGGYVYDRGFLYEPMMTYVPYEAARVEFLNGIVSAWSRTR